MHVATGRTMAVVLSNVAVIAYHSSPLAEPGAGDAGGMTVYVRRLAEAMARLGLRTDIFTRATSSTRPIVTLSPRVRVVSVEAGPPSALSKEELSAHIDEFSVGVRAFALAQRTSYDVVHSHYWQSGLAAKALTKAWRTPFVHSQHTLARVKNQFLAPGDTPESQARIEGEDEVMAAADVLIASTDDEWKQLSCLYGVPHDRLKTIHPGVDHDLFKPGDQATARAALGLGRSGAVLLYAGRIQPLKGLDLALRAVARLADGLDRELVLLVVGGASGTAGNIELQRLHALAEELEISDLVRFVGGQPHSKLPDFYRAADAVVVCSHSESFGLAALEAHACGTPVVGTAVGGLSHIVEDGRSGFLVDRRDPGAFAARLDAIIRVDRLRRFLGANAQKAAATFSWEATAESLFQLYDCLLSEQWPQLCTC